MFLQNLRVPFLRRREASQRPDTAVIDRVAQHLGIPVGIEALPTDTSPMSYTALELTIADCLKGVVPASSLKRRAWIAYQRFSQRGIAA